MMRDPVVLSNLSSFNSRFSPEENEFLAGLPIFRGADARALSAIFSQMRKRTFRKGEVIWHQDDVPSHVYILFNGRIGFKSKAENGREVVISFHTNPGSMFGIRTPFAKERRRLEAVAFSASEAFYLDDETFCNYYSTNENAFHYVLALYSSRLSYLNTKLHDLLFLDGKARLARELLNNHQQDADSDDLALHLSQADLAALTASTPESISRWLKFFERQQAVSVSGRQIQILEPTILQKYALT